MSISTNDIDRAWRKLGLEIRNTGDKHAFLRVEGKVVITTLRSFGSGKLSGNIPHRIRQQLKLNDDQFRDLLRCPLGREEYIDILRQKNLI